MAALGRVWNGPYPSPPSSCSTIAVYHTSDDNTYAAWGYTCLPTPSGTRAAAIDTGCYPWRTAVPEDLLSTGGEYWTPASACPTGWSTAPMNRAPTPTNSRQEVVRCCPSPFARVNQFSDCYLTYPTTAPSMEFPVTICPKTPGAGTGAETTWTWTRDSWVNTTIWATPLEIRHRRTGITTQYTWTASRTGSVGLSTATDIIVGVVGSGGRSGGSVRVRIGGRPLWASL